ncbi:MAG: sigma factor-like helix-turn-helix DNA-binding protein [Prevotella sp.]|nr:sigma factor-like helix-turn-helix DNA-binding protein [Prevotella sp.]
MTAGYISAEAYCALKPKTYLYELKYDECRNYEPRIQKSLERLFEDENIFESLYLQEQFEQDLALGNNQFISWVNSQIKDNYTEVSKVLNQIGLKHFFTNYLFSSPESLYTRSFITEDNLEDIRLFISDCRIVYRKILEDRDGLDPFSIISEKTNSYKNNNSEEGIMSCEPLRDSYDDSSSIITDLHRKDYVSVDEDALSKEHPEHRKYIIYLNRLDEEQFSDFERSFRARVEEKSIRACNCITYIGVREFCINYLFANDLKLLKIRNFGKKSVYDIRGIREEVIEFINNNISNMESSSFEAEIKVGDKKPVAPTLKDKLGDAQYSTLQKVLYQRVETLSVRSKNGIINYKGDFIEDFVHQGMDLKTISLIGRKSEEEITHVVEYIKDMADKMSVRLLTKEDTFIIEKRNLYGDYVDEFSFKYYKEYGHLPMFHILENLIKKDMRLRDLDMLNSNTPLFEGGLGLSYEEIARNFDISRERVRQICTKCNKQLHSVEPNDVNKEGMNYSKLLSQRIDWEYVLESTMPLNWFDLSFVDTIQQEENCNLSKNFILLVLSILCKDNFEVVGADPLPIFTKFKQAWNNTYIVNKTITESFDFYTLKDLIEVKESELTEDITLNAQEMLLDFFFEAWNYFDTDKVEIISKLLTKILINEFGKIPDDDFKFTLEGKKVVQITDLMYDMLYENGNPMSAEELYDAINNIYPNRYKSPTSIKHLVNQDPRICNVGTDNLISLIAWNHVKLGGVRDIIAQFLAEFGQPQHLSVIVGHVQKYRKTSENSIRTTMGSGDQFIVFAGGYYGLKDKVYDNSYYLSESERNFLEHIKQLEQFIKDTGHFPFSLSEDAKEAQLYVWWNKVKNKSTLGKEQSKEVDRILQQYAMYPSSRKDFAWFDFCMRYKTFVERNGRKPSKYEYKEHDLYQWFEKAVEDFSNGDLKPNKEKAYLELCNSL